MLTAITASVVAGCRAGDTGSERQQDIPKTGEKIRVTDFRGKEIVLNAPVERIACMLDSGLTGLHMLGLREEIIALDKWTYDNDGFAYTAKLDPHIGAREVPAVTGNLEKLVSLQPHSQPGGCCLLIDL